MDKNLHNFPARIKSLREKTNMTQAALARKLGITRSGVNLWEMGLSAPSTLYIVELSRLFNVTTDYLLGLDETTVIRTDGLSDSEVAVIINTIQCFHNIRQQYNRQDNT